MACLRLETEGRYHPGRGDSLMGKGDCLMGRGKRRSDSLNELDIVLPGKQGWSSSGECWTQVTRHP